MMKLISELRRRRVFTTAGAYAAIAFVVLQAAQLLLPALTLPDWMYRALVALALAGLPVAIILSWIFQRTPEGIERDSGDVERARPVPRKIAAAQIAVAGAVIMLWLGGVAFLMNGDKQQLRRERIHVLPFANKTGRADLAPIGSMIADWVTQGLQQVPGAQVIDPTRADSGSGVGTIVRGSYYLQNDSIRIEAQIVDVAKNAIQESLQPIAGPVASPTDAIARVSDRLLPLIAVALDKGITTQTRAAVPPSYAAFKELTAGRNARADGDVPGAAQHYRKAIELDSTFGLAWVELVQAYHDGAGSVHDGDSLVTALLKNPDGRFTEFQLMRLQRLQARFHGDLFGAARASERLYALSPNPALALDLLRINRPKRALEIIEESPNENPNGVAARAHHLLGHNRRALKYALRYRALSPNRASGMLEVAIALGANGKIDELRALVQEAALLPRRAWGPDIAVAGAMELHAHGYEAEAKEMLERATATVESRPRGERDSVGYKYQLGNLYYLAGQYEKARALLTAALADSSRIGADQESRTGVVVGLNGALGVLAVRLHDDAEADRIADWLDAHRESAGAIRNGAGVSGWLARMAALRGEQSKAMAYLEEAVAHGWSFDVTTFPNSFGNLHTDPALDALRKQPAFIEFMRPKDE